MKPDVVSLLRSPVTHEPIQLIAGINPSGKVHEMLSAQEENDFLFKTTIIITLDQTKQIRTENEDNWNMIREI